MNVYKGSWSRGVEIFKCQERERIKVTQEKGEGKTK